MKITTVPLLRYLILLALGMMFGMTGNAPAEPQLFWQFEAGQGLFFAPHIDPYTFSAQVHLSLGLGKEPRNFLLGGSLAAVYDNPDWSLMWGGRAVVYLCTLRKAPLDSGPSIPYGTLHLTASVLMERAKVRRLAGGFLVDVLKGSLLLNPRLGYDRQAKRTFLEVGLGMGY